MRAVESNSKMCGREHESRACNTVGRFAPSPTGELHFGSLVAAVGSFFDTRARNGRWLVRIEDLDPPRTVAGSAERQLGALARFGLIPDEPASYQSRFRTRHEAAIARLLDTGLAYPCGCTRRDLPADGIYPGTCRQGIPPERRARSIRFRVEDTAITFPDQVLGQQHQIPARQSGDFVIRRADNLIAYQLAVVVDDAAAGVTDVVRGADLLDSTGRQILLQRAFGLPTPRYLHLPIVVDRQGRKLSKSQADDPIAALPVSATLALALNALGHFPPALDGIDALHDWATDNWDPGRIPHDRVVLQGGRIERYTP